MMTREQARLRLLRRERRIFAMIAQSVRDMKYWNAHRTEHPPIDMGWELAMLRATRRCIRALENDCRDTFNAASEEQQRIMSQIDDHGAIQEHDDA